MNKIKIAILVCWTSLLVCRSLFAADDLALPYEDEGACPFECCTYREWGVIENTMIYKTRDPGAEALFTVRKGDQVKGITGVVVTLEPGRALIKKPVTLGIDDQVTIPAGETLEVLHYEGEGIFKFWFSGRTYSEELPFPDEETDSIKTVGAAKTVWWVKIENAKRQSGWSKETDHFSHMDSCE